MKRFLRLPVVEDRTGKSRSTIYEEMERGQFPRAIKIGPRAVGWLEDEIEEWIKERIEARDRVTQGEPGA